MALTAVLLPAAAHALQPAPGSGPVTRDESSPAALIYHADTIAVLRAEVGGIPPSRRVEIAQTRLEALRRVQMLQPVRIEPLGPGHAVLVGDVFVFGIVTEDVDAPTGQTSAQAAEVAAQRLGRALGARARMLTPGHRWRQAIAALVATLVLVVGIRVLIWARRRVTDWVTVKTQARKGILKLGELDFLAQFSLAFSWIARIATQIGALALVAIWAIFILNRFPETQRWGLAARSSLLGSLLSVEQGVLRAIPGLIAIALIIVVGRFAARLATDLFHGIEQGTIQLRLVHPETAGATRRLVITLIWLFAIVVAYPFVPGSDSNVFKGVSVFLGVIISLGSSGVVGHMMSGLVLVYSRALRPGDVVRVNDIEGVVTEVGTLAVKICNAKKEEYTIPNAVIVGTTVKNYTRQARESGGILSTSVAIGYDAPWRVVYQLLHGAADRTSGILKEPAPVVFQPSLSTFSVEYQLVVRLEPSANRLAVLTQLHQNIQDAFNEGGIQIMVPAYESQPERPIVIPKAKWSESPGG
jgi:small-conductance mechanosensitive channel